VSKTKNIILGYSGHAYVVLDAAEKAGLYIEAYAEKEQRTLNPFKLEYLGFEGDGDFDGWDKGYEFILGIGDNRIRERVTKLIVSKREKLLSVVHPSANIGSFVEIGDGSFIAAGAMINPYAKIGKSVIINTGAIVEHECQIGDCTHIAPGAVIAGNVKVGDRSFIGANSVIKEGVEIGSDVIIGAGTVVLDNLKSESKVVGNPGRFI
jgi:sugar O-acyltransferase (sialic acid O-acetyltransferase NeuD family)